MLEMMPHLNDPQFVYEENLFWDGVSLSALAAEFGTPLYVYSSEAFLSRLQKLQKGLRGIENCICFAMKSNSNLSILRLLSEAGAGVDVVSGGELFRAQKAGIPGSRVVFSGVGKTRREIQQALEYSGSGIYSFHVESLNELRVLNEVAHAKGVIAPVALRFNPDVDPQTHPYISTGIKKNKFGMDRGEVRSIFKHLNEFSNIRLKGISIHIGSQLLSLDPLEDAFQRLTDLVKEFNFSFEYVDLGGGLGIRYHTEEPPSVESYCQLIQRYFGALSPFGGKLKIVLEPGRQISGNAGILLTQVLYRKERKSQDFLIVDAAMTDLVRPALYGSYHEIIPVQQAHVGQSLKKTMIVGPVCESSDFLGKGRQLSRKLKEGDLLAVLSAGAYGFVMSSQYNSRPRPAEVLIQNGRATLIRKRESYESLIEGEGLLTS